MAKNDRNKEGPFLGPRPGRVTAATPNGYEHAGPGDSSRTVWGPLTPATARDNWGVTPRPAREK